MRSVVRPVLAALLVLTTAAAAAAQGAPRSPAFAGWRDGFVLESEGGDNRLQFNGLFQVDGRFALEDGDDSFDDTFLLRRIRPTLQGRIARYFEFNLQPDFAGSDLNLRTAFIETRLSPALRIRVGKDKQPFGLERLHSSSNLLFVERSLTSTVIPDRDVGVQVLGEVAGGRATYQVGLFNGAVDGGNLDADSSDGKDLVGRVVTRPWMGNTDSPLSGLGLALAASVGSQPDTLPSFRTTLQQTFFSYRPGAVGTGTRSRISPQAFYYSGPFGGYAEFVRSRGAITMGPIQDDITHRAWQIAGSYVLTGERATDRGVRPARPFDPSRGEWGAFQVAARYHVLDLDPRARVLGFTSASALGVRSFGAGLNWYLNPYLRWMVNVERISFDDELNDSPLSTAVLFVRHQIAF